MVLDGPRPERRVRDVGGEAVRPVLRVEHAALVHEPGVEAGPPAGVLGVRQVAVPVAVGGEVERRDGATVPAAAVRVVPAEQTQGDRRCPACGRAEPDVVEPRAAADRRGDPGRGRVEGDLPAAAQAARAVRVQPQRCPGGGAALGIDRGDVLELARPAPRGGRAEADVDLAELLGEPDAQRLADAAEGERLVGGAGDPGQVGEAPVPPRYTPQKRFTWTADALMPEKPIALFTW